MENKENNLTHRSVVDWNPSVVHVLYKCYLSGSPKEIIGYFIRPIQGVLAFNYYVSTHDGVRQIYYELEPDYDIEYLLPINNN